MTDAPIRAALRAAFLRVQDRDGRGPFKPGMPDKWRDLCGNDFPSVQDEFGVQWRAEIPRGWHCGCAFRSIEQARLWFSPHECFRLNALGYRLVQMSGHAIRESRNQAIIVRPRAFRRDVVPMPWPHEAPALLEPWKHAAALARAAEGEG